MQPLVKEGWEQLGAKPSLDQLTQRLVSEKRLLHDITGFGVVGTQQELTNAGRYWNAHSMKAEIEVPGRELAEIM